MVKRKGGAGIFMSKKERIRDSRVEEARDLDEYCNGLIRDMRHAQRVLIDLMLFLDTHPMDLRARQQYMSWRHHYLMLKQRYQEACGPLEWYGPNWWQRAMGYGYDPLDECFEESPQAYLHER